MTDGLLVETRMCLAALQQTAPPAPDLVDEHRVLRDAVREGDGARLVARLEAHMNDAVTRILAAMPDRRTRRPAPPPASPPERRRHPRRGPASASAASL